MTFVAKGTCDVCQKLDQAEADNQEDAMVFLYQSHGNHVFKGNVSFYQKPDKIIQPVGVDVAKLFEERKKPNGQKMRPSKEKF